MSKIPYRMCVISHERMPKSDLIRVVRTSSSVVVDPSGKISGKGAYLKKDKNIIMKAKSSKVLDKILEVEVPSTIYDELISYI